MSEDSFTWRSEVNRKLVDGLLEDLLHQIILVLIMAIEGCSVHPGAFGNVSNRDGIKPALCAEFNECLLEQLVGSLLGTAVLGTIVAHSATGGRSTTLSLAARQALAMSIDQVFLVTFGVAVAILIVTLFLKDERLRKRGESKS